MSKSPRLLDPAAVGTVALKGAGSGPMLQGFDMQADMACHGKYSSSNGAVCNTSKRTSIPASKPCAAMMLG